MQITIWISTVVVIGTIWWGVLWFVGVIFIPSLTCDSSLSYVVGTSIPCGGAIYAIWKSGKNKIWVTVSLFLKKNLILFEVEDIILNELQNVLAVRIVGYFKNNWKKTFFGNAFHFFYEVNYVTIAQFFTYLSLHTDSSSELQHLKAEIKRKWLLINPKTFYIKINYLYLCKKRGAMKV